MSKNARPFLRGDRVALRIDRLAIGGRGVGRYQGMVVFVANVAPEEDVEVEITFVKKNFAEARLLKVINPSQFRTNPPCPVAGICGGCSWQQVSYSEQLKQKRSLVSEALQKFSGFSEFEVMETCPSPLEFRYRNRIQLHHAAGRMGFHKPQSHDIVDINDCPITDELIAREIPSLKAKLANAKPGRIEVYLSQEMKVAMRTPEFDEEGAGPAFSQVNSSQNSNLVAAAIAIAQRELGDHENPLIYDLYSGSGNFTFPLAAALPRAKIVGVEMNLASVERGQKLAATQPRVTFVAQAVDAYLKARPQKEIPTFILLDPPRTGCGPDVMSAIARRNVEKVLYVSCHPVTFARDIKALAEAGYKLDSVQPFDMFPQTDHVEVVAYLAKPR